MPIFPEPPIGEEHPITSAFVEVGQIVKITQGQEFPADIILLHTSREDGTCYVNTANLDGEAAPKVRSASAATQSVYTSPEALLTRLAGRIQYEAPNASLYRFQGNVLLKLLVGKRAAKAAGPLATLMMVASFVTGLVTFVQVTHRPAGDRSFIKPVYDWIVSGSFGVSLDLRIDPLSLVMVLVVTGVGALIHLYSIGYMHDDPRYPRYFAYLNLFAFSMLLLVLANNFLVLYAGWELVGLCSYLLIGFWFERPSASSAAKKAFITNRVGESRVRDRDRADLRFVRLPRLRRGLLPDRLFGRRERHGDGDRAAAAGRRRR